jgi:hypothetical protein
MWDDIMPSRPEGKVDMQLSRTRGLGIARPAAGHRAATRRRASYIGPCTPSPRKQMMALRMMGVPAPPS